VWPAEAPMVVPPNTRSTCRSCRAGEMLRLAEAIELQVQGHTTVYRLPMRQVGILFVVVAALALAYAFLRRRH
jgi:hypothetical protein